MAVEISNARIDILKNIYLLQTNEFNPAASIKDPEFVDKNTLFSFWSFAKDYVNAHGFAAVAFTQFDPKTLSGFTGNSDLTNIIYFDGYDSLYPGLQDSLVLNPTILKSSDGFYLRDEGCGSIEKGRYKMIVKRPMSVVLEAYVYNPPMNYPVKMTDYLSGESASVALHEITHLKGKTAVTDDPRRIMDFTEDGPNWQNCNKTQKEYSYLVQSFGKNYEWLVCKNGKLIVIDARGRFIRDYVKPGK